MAKKSLKDRIADAVGLGESEAPAPEFQPVDAAAGDAAQAEFLAGEQDPDAEFTAQQEAIRDEQEEGARQREAARKERASNREPRVKAKLSEIEVIIKVPGYTPKARWVGDLQKLDAAARAQLFDNLIDALVEASR